nr:MAG TPA: hypothetical protein [Caudoviricetes sp.]
MYVKIAVNRLRLIQVCKKRLGYAVFERLKI